MSFETTQCRERLSRPRVRCAFIPYLNSRLNLDLLLFYYNYYENNCVLIVMCQFGTMLGVITDKLWKYGDLIDRYCCLFFFLMQFSEKCI